MRAYSSKSEGGTGRAHEPFAGPSFQFDVAAQAEQLRQGREWTNTGRNAKTLVKYPDLRIILTVIRAGTRINEHQTAARLSVQVLSGHIKMEVDGMLFDLPVGTLLALDRDMPHDVMAVEDSTFLITIAWSEGAETH